MNTEMIYWLNNDLTIEMGNVLDAALKITNTVNCMQETTVILLREFQQVGT
ncbi:hypothetical protein HanRHA438_Chr05g0203101 [Helianthus annuus]|nr:hypothetical protein HanRHA438_Chr05g0203101 [Helianthus annuus]